MLSHKCMSSLRCVWWNYVKLVANGWLDLTGSSYCPMTKFLKAVMDRNVGKIQVRVNDHYSAAAS